MICLVSSIVLHSLHHEESAFPSLNSRLLGTRYVQLETVVAPTTLLRKTHLVERLRP